MVSHIPDQSACAEAAGKHNNTKIKDISITSTNLKFIPRIDSSLNISGFSLYRVMPCLGM